MESAQVKPNPAFPSLIMLIVTLPFVLLGWLLIDSLLGDIRRYERVDQAMLLFERGIQVAGYLEQVRDLGAARFHGSGAVLQGRHLQALQQLDEALPAFLQAVGERDGMLSGDQIAAIIAARQALTQEPVQADFMVMFDASSTLIDRVYEALFTELHVTDMLVGEPVSANELLLILGGKVRSARQNIGMLRTLSLQASLGSGFLASGDAGRFDVAWGGLHDDLLSLDRQFRVLQSRGVSEQCSNAMRLGHSGAWAYLELMAEQVLVSDRVELAWHEADQAGQQAMDAMAAISASLLDEVRVVADKAEIAALRMNVMLLLGLIVLYLLLLGFALMLYRSRYEILRVQTENRTKSQFLARMSHEIRTPLNGVIGLAELLRDTSPTLQQRQYIDLIERSGRSLIGLINDVLDHARIEAGKLELEKISFSLPALISECANIFSLRAHDNDTVIFYSVEEGVPESVIGDPSRLRQVLINLLSNAVKFTEHGLVELVVTLKGKQADHFRLSFQVRDSGIGLTMEEQSNLFDLFSQASASVSRRYGGSGLGLSISRELVQLMGGDIGVRSARNWGSTFYFELNLASDGDALARQSQPPVSEAVLLDHSGQLRRLVQGRQRYRGVRVVSNVGACVELLRESHTPLVVIHSQQPDSSLESLLAPLQPFADRCLFRLVVGVRGGVAPELLSRMRVADLKSCTVFDDQRLADLFQLGVRDTVEDEERPQLPQYQRFVGMKVLIAEDNPVNQIVTEGMLKRLGAETRVVADGLQALSAYEQLQGRYDLVLMDLDMPNMDGAASAREIRALERRQGWAPCRIIALSAHVLPEYRQAVSEAGMDGQLTKPVTLNQLAEALAGTNVTDQTQ
ncbi:ATP-binding protein [Alcanivorax sp. 1008]|uniref:hybrid sensor histidine kinase/response regulator n=1 Tax=Alcanivorax sp. 1008 TaxID=2816853 RepID=UPI001DA1132C|nr:ATP-binding protein [Alcanivorax sp. 1008]MCC1497928.1 response regulator [Alcanivorax sp. 1008]